MSEKVYYDFSELFEADEYLYFMEDTLRTENTGAQIDFIERALQLTPPQRVLDLGCGHGRHSIELALRGYAVTGIDLSESFLASAQRDATLRGAEVQFALGDIGAFEAPACFDAVVCLFDAFGFFEDDHCLRTLRCAYAALAPGGRFLLDLRTREWMLRLPPAAVVEKPNGDMMIDRHRFYADSARFVDRRTYLRGAVRRDVTFSVRLFALHEIQALIEEAGFELEQAFGGFDGGAASKDRPRTLLVGRKPASAA